MPKQNTNFTKTELCSACCLTRTCNRENNSNFHLDSSCLWLDGKVGFPPGTSWKLSTWATISSWWPPYEVYLKVFVCFISRKHGIVRIRLHHIVGAGEKSKSLCVALEKGRQQKNSKALYETGFMALQMIIMKYINYFLPLSQPEP